MGGMAERSAPLVFIPTAAQLKRAKAEGWEDWIRSPTDEIAVAQGCYFDLEAALKTRSFFEKRLTHSKAPFAGQPFLLMDWQWQDIIGPLYGWKMPDGTRRFLSAYIEIPKKNGKTQTAAGIALRETYEQVGARVYLTATAAGQAAECFDEAACMVRAKKHAFKALRVFDANPKRIVHRKNNAVMSVLNTAGPSSEGKNASCIIKDELHAWVDREYYDSLKYAMATRTNSLDLAITTAGDNLTSIGYEEHLRAERVIAGKDPAYEHLAVIYAADRDADFRDLAQWKKANPSYGVTLNERKIAVAIAEAEASPQRVSALKRYRLNIWTQGKAAWLDVAKWNGLAAIRREDLAGRYSSGGLDLARVRDFAAFAQSIELDAGEDGTIPVAILVRLWIPEDLVAEKAATDKIPLQGWVDQGWVIATPGDEIDYGEIRRQILDDHRANPLNSLGYDPHNAALLCNQTLGAQDGINVVEIPQTMAYMGPPSAEFERNLGKRIYVHEQNPCLAWMIGNAVAAIDANGNTRPVKKKSTGRIDGLVATIMAEARRNAGGGNHFYDNQEPELV